MTPVGHPAISYNYKSKVTLISRDISVATGSVAYTGIGFQASKILAIAYVNNTLMASLGFSDKNKDARCLIYDTTPQWTAGGTNLIYISHLAGPGSARASVSSYDADGFTLSWTKSGTPTGTAEILILALE